MTSSHERNAIAAVSAVVFDLDGRILLLRRKGAHGAGQWHTPGGKTIHGESPEQTVIRETLEETGIQIGEARFATYTNDFFEEDGLHSINLWFVAPWVSGVPQIMEPQKADDLSWFHLRNLPSPLFLSFHLVDIDMLECEIEDYVYDLKREK